MLENTLVKVQEDDENAQFCLLIENPVDECPVPFPFQIYISTINGTAGNV